MFGVPFPPLKERMDRFECGARHPRALAGRPVTLEQPYYALRDAESYPCRGGRVPLIVGGRGEKRTLPIVAAAPTSGTPRASRSTSTRQRAVLDALCRTVGATRSPSAVADGAYIVGRDARERDARLAKARQIFPRVPDSEAAWRAVASSGRSRRHRERAQALAAVGVTRVMLQTLDMEDFAAIELLAREVMPACR